MKSDCSLKLRAKSTGLPRQGDGEGAQRLLHHTLTALETRPNHIHTTTCFILQYPDFQFYKTVSIETLIFP